MKKLLIFICILSIGLFISGCGIFEKDITVTSIQVNGDKTEFDENFKLSDISVKVINSDGSSKVVPLTSGMISSEDLAKFQTEGQHSIKVKYLGAETSFEIKIVGEKGADGKEVELQVADDYIQWRYKGTSTWTNLVSLSSLNGEDGEDGEDGKEVELEIVEGFIKYRYKGESTWINLVELSTLIGPKGTDGKEIEIQVSDGFVQWRHKGDPTWSNLIEVSKLVGPKGEDGFEVELQLKDNYIQYKHINDTEWTNLISLNIIRGDVGPAGPAGPGTVIEISEDGYWIINGFKTTHKAVYTPEIQKFKVTFDANGGEMPEDYSNILENINQGSTIDLPIPTHPNLTFMGWFTGVEIHDSQFGEFDTVESDLVLIAKWDYSLENLEKFLNITNSKSYSLSIYKKHVDIDNDYENYITSNYYLDNNGNLNTHDNYLNIDYLQKYERFCDDYYLYTEGKDFDFYSYGEGWEFESDTYEEYYYLDLSYLNLNKFIHTDKSHIYQYPVNTDLFMAIQDYYIEDCLSSINYGNSYSYIDLENMKFVVNIEGYYVDEKSSIYIEYSISDVGSTFVTFPVEEVKLSIIDKLENYMDYDDFIFATEESKNTFLLRLNEMKDIITSENDLEVLYELNNSFYMELYNFDFIRDDVAYERYIFIDDLCMFFEEISLVATDESIANMQAILNTAITNINSSTIIEAQSIVYFAEIAIEEAFVEDPIKVELENYKMDTVQDLYLFAEELSEYLQDYDQIFDIINMYEIRFREAKSKDEVDEVEIIIIERFQSNELIYDFDRLQNLKFQYYYSNIKYFNEGINSFANYPQEIYDLHNESINAIFNGNSYFEVLDAYFLYLDKLYPLILKHNKDAYIERMNIPYNEKLLFAKDADVIIIESIFNTYKELINNEPVIKNVHMLFNNYLSEIYIFTPDEIKLEKNNCLEMLKNNYKSLLEFSTYESSIQITIKYEIAITNINNSLTIDEVRNNLEAGNNTMASVYVTDYNKIDLQIYKVSTVSKMRDLVNGVNNYVESYHSYKTNELIDKYIPLINTCTTKEEVDSTYILWYEDLLNIVVDIQLDHFMVIRNYMINDINNAIEFISENYLETQSAYLTKLQNALAVIDQSYHLVKVINAINDLGGSPVDYIKQLNTNQLTSIYNQFMELLDDADKIELETQYNSYYLIEFNTADDYNSQYQIIVSFNEFCFNLLYE